MLEKELEELRTTYGLTDGCMDQIEELIGKAIDLERNAVFLLIEKERQTLGLIHTENLQNKLRSLWSYNP